MSSDAWRDVVDAIDKLVKTEWIGRTGALYEALLPYRPEYSPFWPKNTISLGLFIRNAEGELLSEHGIRLARRTTRAGAEWAITRVGKPEAPGCGP